MLYLQMEKSRTLPSIGPIRAALLMALIQTPHRFRTKRQLWTYSGLGIETHDSAEYRYVQYKDNYNVARNRYRFVTSTVTTIVI
jgi:transposase